MSGFNFSVPAVVSANRNFAMMNFCCGTPPLLVPGIKGAQPIYCLVTFISKKKFFIEGVGAKTVKHFYMPGFGKSVFVIVGASARNPGGTEEN